MKIAIAALGILLLVSTTSFAAWYVAPTVVQAYYPMAPVYTYAPPVVVAPAPRVTYMPVVAPAPQCVYYAAPVVAPVPVVVARPAVVRTRVFYPGQPVRNIVKAVVP
jgi:hypothetical protein